MSLGWAIVGCGRVAEHRFAPALLGCAEARLVAFVSRELGKARAFADRFSAPAAYASVDELARDERVDAVYVATPNALHVEPVCALLAAGKHVLTDKPMALSLADCERMIDTARRAGRLLGVLHQQRFHPVHQRAIELASRGRLGPLTMLTAEMGFNYPPARVWRQELALAGGGPGMDLAPHALDVMLQVAGPVQRVRGRIANLRHRYEVEDHFIAEVDFAGGAAATLTMSYCSAWTGGRLSIHGEAGALVADGTLMASPRYRAVIRFGPDSPPTEMSDDQFAGCFPAAVADFCEAVREGRPPRITGADGLAVMRVVDAIYRSARDGGVSVELAPFGGPA